MVNFTDNEKENAIILKIVRRAIKLKIINGIALDAQMDISACHSNGNNLDLQRFLDADNFNFTHDFCGIQSHIDRTTGKLKNCFVPRFSK